MVIIIMANSTVGMHGWSFKLCEIKRLTARISHKNYFHAIQNPLCKPSSNERHGFVRVLSSFMWANRFLAALEASRACEQSATEVRFD